MHHAVSAPLMFVNVRRLRVPITLLAPEDLISASIAQETKSPLRQHLDNILQGSSEASRSQLSTTYLTDQYWPNVPKGT